MRISGAALLVVALVLWTTESGTADAVPNQTIRVAIVKQAATVVVDGVGLLAKRENGDALVVVPPVTLRPGGEGILLDGVGYRRLTFSAPGAVFINGKPYRGQSEISFGDRGILVVNELLLEEYLVGLINCEVSSSWPIESVKAQAVIARTYALYRKELKKNAPFHLESSVLDQVYDGCLIEDSRAKRAVSETAGEVLTYNRAIIQAFYHSNCGGKTETSENVWGLRLPYLKGVTCEYCLGNSSSNWEQKLELKDIEERLRAAGFKVSGVTDIRPGGRNNRGRLKNISVVSGRGTVTLAGDQFRKILGYGVIKSTNFSVRVSDGAAVFSGIGNGHGVGLCQWGAKQRALNGFSYTEILSYYYPGTVLEKVL
ncbi:MAG: SpoIID/LytB domain-containing protein [Desulfuromonadales bacterium]|nr:SpoIID/LytB domain-containing protein [Desulfuromonadales bacterium]